MGKGRERGERKILDTEGFQDVLMQTLTLGPHPFPDIMMR
jgi:hypothetical protein